MNNEQPGSYFPELGNNLDGLKYLNSFMRIRDQGWKKFASGINIPDPQHWLERIIAGYITPRTYYIFVFIRFIRMAALKRIFPEYLKLIILQPLFVCYLDMYRYDLKKRDKTKMKGEKK
jgi:hypothetical protein